MKCFFAALAVLVCSVVSYASDCQPPQTTCMSASGEAFTLEPNAPAAMQPAYKDSSGLVWGEYMRDKYGWNRFSFDVAKYMCESVNVGNGTARMPTVQEVLKLRESMSHAPNPNSTKELIAKGSTSNKTFDFDSANFMMWGAEFWANNGEWITKPCSGDPKKECSYQYVIRPSEWHDDGVIELNSSGQYSPVKCVYDSKVFKAQ